MLQAIIEWLGFTKTAVELTNFLKDRRHNNYINKHNDHKLNNQIKIKLIKNKQLIKQ